MSNLVQQQVEAEIMEIFRRKIKGREEPSFDKSENDGAGGYWLQEQFGIPASSSGAPDFKGYELKKETRNKTTFGDWRADVYVFSSDIGSLTKESFLRIFGSPNKDGRYSWSGACFPKVGEFNQFGQTLYVTKSGDVIAIYNYAHDKRDDRGSIVPDVFKFGDVTLAYWTSENLRSKVEEKFNIFGWFSVKKNKDGVYDSVVFGARIDFSLWIASVRSGEIYLDSGMYDGNSRLYQSWRASNTYWESLIVRTMS